MHDYYNDWTHKRIKLILNNLTPNFFSGKSIVELGAGYGDVIAAFSRLGGICTAFETRQESINIGKRKYSHVNFQNCNVEANWPLQSKVDIIINTDFLSHTNDPEFILRKSCEYCDLLILESECLDSYRDDFFININEGSAKNLAIGNAKKFTAAFVERILRESGFSYQRFDDEKLNVAHFNYSWKESGTDRRNYGQRRFWIARRTGSPIYNPLPIIQQQSILPNFPIYPINDFPGIMNKISKGEWKTAICLSGHLRTFEKTINSFKRAFEPLKNYDVFIHTWDNLGFDPSRGDIGLANINTNNLRQKINEVYNPKVLTIDPYLNQNGDKYRFAASGVRDPGFVLGMFYSLKQANLLKKNWEKSNNFKYDLVIRARADIIYDNQFSVQDILNLDSICIPNHGWSGMNDQFAFSNSKFMDIYSMCYDYIDDYIMNMHVSFHPETIIKRHLEFFNLPIRFTNNQFGILRGNGQVFRNERIR